MVLQIVCLHSEGLIEVFARVKVPAFSQGWCVCVCGFFFFFFGGGGGGGVHG